MLVELVEAVRVLPHRLALLPTYRLPAAEIVVFPIHEMVVSGGLELLQDVLDTTSLNIIERGELELALGSSCEAFDQQQGGVTTA